MMKTSPILLLVISSFIAASSQPLLTQPLLVQPLLNKPLLTISAGKHAPVVTHGVDPQTLITESCASASKFDGRFTKEYCIASVNAAQFNRAVKMSMHDLASIGLDILYKNVSATKAKVDVLAHGPEGQKSLTVRNMLQHCSSMYSEATHRLKDGLKHMEKKEFMEADRTVSMIQGDGSECEDQFVAEGITSPLTKQNLDCEYLGGMATLFIRFFDRSYTPWGVPIIKP